MRFVLSVRHDGETLRSYVLDVHLPSVCDAYLLLGEEMIAECTDAGQWEHLGDTKTEEVDELAPSSVIDLAGDDLPAAEQEP